MTDWFQSSDTPIADAKDASDSLNQKRYYRKTSIVLVHSTDDPDVFKVVDKWLGEYIISRKMLENDYEELM